jgi:hypothetical protein
MSLKEEITLLALKGEKIRVSDMASKYKVSRQYLNSIISPLVKKGELVKIGSTRNVFYISPAFNESIDKTMVKRLRNRGLHDHEVFEDMDRQILLKASVSEDLYSIFYYAFTEMLNNAIDHSKSENIQVEVGTGNNLQFTVNDVGIGVFRNIMKKRKLNNETEAIQDLLKGKITTMPKMHSGEGIFFTSKIADLFILESFGRRLTFDNRIDDIFLEEVKPVKRGTKVSFTISSDSKKHLDDIFKKYHSNPEEIDFDKTEIFVKLYTKGTIHISRSQAKRITAGLEKFKLIVLDFDKVPTVGQAFADEIFRVFQNKYPDIKIEPVNMNESVRFMITRATRNI